MTDPSPYLFWITSRAAGTTALIASSASVSIGLAMGGKLFKAWGRDRRVIHQTLALTTMLAIAVHALALLGDGYLHPSVFDVTVPFVSSYETVATSIGIIAGWGIVVLGLSYHLRSRIGHARWKIIHRFTLLAWLLGVVHTLTEGTDAGQPWFTFLVVVSVAPVLVLMAMRVRRRRVAVRRAPVAVVSSR